MTDKVPKPVKVGSGITEYEREPVLMDAPTRWAYLTGEFVPTGVRPFGEPSLQSIRSKAEMISKTVFTNSGLPDPFLLLDIKRELPPIDWGMALLKGHDYLVDCFDRGYRTSASLYCPDEDHSQLWYASAIATSIARYDALVLRVRSGKNDVETEIAMAATFGAHLGGLLAECDLKFTHENDALRGKGVVRDASKGGQAVAKTHADRLAGPLKDLEDRIAKGERKHTAAGHVVKRWNLAIKGSSLVATFDRRQRKTQNRKF